jgi:hypothetical protein
VRKQKSLSSLTMKKEYPFVKKQNRNLNPLIIEGFFIMVMYGES